MEPTTSTRVYRRRDGRHVLATREQPADGATVITLHLAARPKPQDTPPEPVTTALAVAA